MADKQKPEQSGFPELIDIDTLAGVLGLSERYVRRMVFKPEIEIPRPLRS